MVKIAPSLLASDFGRLAEEIRDVEESGADLVHVDVMDGHFVPNITIGPCVVRAISKYAKTMVQVHLMIEEPERYYDDYVRAGADDVIFHIEIDIGHAELAGRIRDAGASPGISLNPKTPVEALEPVRGEVDTVLVMSVEPGFGGQEFMPDALGRIGSIREMMGDVSIVVDGGVTAGNASGIVAAGADVLVAGTAVFGLDDRAAAIRTLKGMQ